MKDKEVDNSESNIIHSYTWSHVLKELNTYYGDAIFNSWFNKIYLKGGNKNKVILSVPTRFIRDWIKTNYLEKVRALFVALDPNIIEVELQINHNQASSGEFTNKNINTHNNSYSKPAYNIVNNNAQEIAGSHLDPRFTFDNFVVGPPNELAYAASQAVADSQDAVLKSNPLFLYGGVGLGKTHLMHAIAWHIRESNPRRKVIYMSAEKFMYQFVKALRDKNVMSFKERFRSVDVLMIDDIQFICGKESTQEEFFHTFNTLIDNNRQMVISCDRSPTDLDNIEDRIRSRLGWGLVADVHSTTYELRLGILQSKVEQIKANVSKDVLEFLASKITSNVRELEGALNKVIAHSTLVGREVNIQACQDILKDLIRSNEKYVTVEDIQKKVAELYNIKIADMSSSRRQRSIARPRQVAMFLAKTLTTKSLSDIGKKFGKKDHTTVMHACKQIEKLKNEDQELQEEINLLTRVLQK